MQSPGELRALADRLERLQKVESDFLAAKAAYQADTSDPELKARYREASQLMAETRASHRAESPDPEAVRPESIGASVKED